MNEFYKNYLVTRLMWSPLNISKTAKIKEIKNNLFLVDLSSLKIDKKYQFLFEELLLSDYQGTKVGLCHRNLQSITIYFEYNINKNILQDGLYDTLNDRKLTKRIIVGRGNNSFYIYSLEILSNLKNNLFDKTK